MAANLWAFIYQQKMSTHQFSSLCAALKGKRKAGATWQTDYLKKYFSATPINQNKMNNFGFWWMEDKVFLQFDHYGI